MKVENRRLKQKNEGYGEGYPYSKILRKSPNEEPSSKIALTPYSGLSSEPASYTLPSYSKLSEHGEISSHLKYKLPSEQKYETPQPPSYMASNYS